MPADGSEAAATNNWDARHVPLAAPSSAKSIHLQKGLRKEGDRKNFSMDEKRAVYLLVPEIIAE